VILFQIDFHHLTDNKVLKNLSQVQTESRESS